MIDVGGTDYAGPIMGMSNTIATIPGIVGNLVTGYLLQHTQSWSMVFRVAACVSVLGGMVFASASTDQTVSKQKQDTFQDDEDDDEQTALLVGSNA